MSHVILLGDSIFDNAAYVAGAPSVTAHLARALPQGWRATLLAVDGSTVEDVSRQLSRVPADATHLVISAGGNDALGHSSTLLGGRPGTHADALTLLARIRGDFQRAYRAMLAAVVKLGKPTAVCTIYDAIPTLSEAGRAGLCVFNDVILREAFWARLPVIDLRLICTEPDDYAASSPIEPSGPGGAKIARAVSRLVTSDTSSGPGVRVFVS